MGGRDARHPERAAAPVGRLARWVPIGLVLAVLAAAGVGYAVDDRPDPDTEPAAVPPPPGLTLPAVQAPPDLAEPATGRPDPGRVRRAIAPLLDDPDLGRHVRASVASLDGRELYSSGTGAALPASNLKLLTATAALAALGPEHTFDTRVVADGRRGVVLVGGGDPQLSVADLRRLAHDTADALGRDGRGRGRPEVTVAYDDGLFSGPEVSPRWEPGYVPEEVIPISALAIGDSEGRPPVSAGDDPAAIAATVFAQALARDGVETVGIPTRRRAPADAAALAEVTSDRLDQLVEHTLLVSDNFAAEVLARHVGLETSGEGSFAAGARGVVATLDRLGVPLAGAEVYDGSGLSRDDRLQPETLTAVLALAASDGHPELRAVLTGLPVAGFSGSLAYRFTVASAAGRGVVRAKTGTLTGVSGLAGIVTDEQGTPMVFAVLSDKIAPVDTLDARAALDGITSALAGCRCG